jgi:hypothetical protein
MVVTVHGSEEKSKCFAENTPLSMTVRRARHHPETVLSLNDLLFFSQILNRYRRSPFHTAGCPRDARPRIIGT